MKRRKLNTKPITMTSPQSAVSEAFRTLKTNLQFANIAMDTRVILLTSSLPNEGKTTTAANLAVTYAQTGQRVLLIDGDLRNPQLHYHFEISNMRGLSTALLKELPIGACTCPSNVEGLSILPAGATPPNPLAIVSSPAFCELITWCKNNYDVVIIDSPPIIPVSDSLALASVADGVLFVVRCNKTQKPYVKQAMQDLSNVQARIIGIVLNRAKQTKRQRKLTKKYYSTLPHRSRVQQSDLPVFE